MSPDSVNQLTVGPCKRCEYIETVEFVKGFINLCKELKALRLNTAEEIKQHVIVNKLDDRVIEYTISNVKAYGPYEEIKIFINPTHEPFNINLEKRISHCCRPKWTFETTSKIGSNND